MESITIGQLATAIGTLTVIVGFFVAIFKWYQSNISDEFRKLHKKIDDHINLADKRIEEIEEKAEMQDREMQESKEERLILLKGLLACLEGLKQGGANGPVTKAIDEINNYLLGKSHE